MKLRAADEGATDIRRSKRGSMNNRYKKLKYTHNKTPVERILQNRAVL